MNKKKGLSLEEAVFLTLEDSGHVTFQSINEMHNLLRKEVNKTKN